MTSGTRTPGRGAETALRTRPTSRRAPLGIVVGASAPVFLPAAWIRGGSVDCLKT